VRQRRVDRRSVGTFAFGVICSGDSKSSVAVVAPSFSVASYALGWSIIASHSFVALPTSTTSTPVAKGSSVPAWPTFVPRGSRRFTRSTTRADVRPAGLSITITPLIELVSDTPRKTLPLGAAVR